MLKAYVETPAHLSQAMHRVARALRKYAPPAVQIVNHPEEADLQVLHVIGEDALTYQQKAPLYAIIQYCLLTTGNPLSDRWSAYWQGANMVWSYYDLAPHFGDRNVNFYHAPLGLDPAFLSGYKAGFRTGVLTTGYVHGSCAEAIQEPAFAADRCGMPTIHLGPRPVGMNMYPRAWESIQGVNDEVLAGFYSRVSWVSGLRHVEGFELPVIEGLACGARPVVFDRAETRHWFSNHAVFLPECEGSELIDRLTMIFTCGAQPVSLAERQDVINMFNWEKIIGGFWATLGETL